MGFGGVMKSEQMWFPVFGRSLDAERGSQWLKLGRVSLVADDGKTLPICDSHCHRMRMPLATGVPMYRWDTLRGNESEKLRYEAGGGGEDCGQRQARLGESRCGFC